MLSICPAVDMVSCLPGAHAQNAPDSKSAAATRRPSLHKRQPCYRARFLRRGGRVVECTALEMRRRRKSTVGSNPTLSAIISLTDDRYAMSSAGAA